MRILRLFTNLLRRIFVKRIPRQRAKTPVDLLHKMQQSPDLRIWLERCENKRELAGMDLRLQGLVRHCVCGLSNEDVSRSLSRLRAVYQTAGKPAGEVGLEEVLESEIFTQVLDDDELAMFWCGLLPNQRKDWLRKFLLAG